MKEEVRLAMSQPWQQEKRAGVSTIVNFTKDLLQEKGEISPQFWLEKKSEKDINMVTGVLVFETKTKDLALEALRDMVQKFKADTCYVAFEGWYSAVATGDLPYIQPSKSVDRKEAVVIGKFTKSMKNVTVTIPFTRENEKIVFGKQIKSKEGITIWNPFLEFEGVRERFDKDIDKTDDAFFKKQAKILSKKYSKKVEEASSEEEMKKIVEMVLKDMEELKKKVEDNFIEDET